MSTGLKGLLKVVPYTDDPKRFLDLKCIFVEKEKQLLKFAVESVRFHKNTVLLKLESIDDIDKALEYKGCYLKIDRKDLKELPEDTYYIADLINLDVYTDDNKLLGKLADIYNTGSSDIYVVKTNLGKQILLPAIADVVKSIDIKTKKIIVHLLEGLET